jgi:hypothetical protein
MRLRKVGQARILDFDIETVAAGFADPEWVPQKITCVAWSWIDSDVVESRVCGPAGLFGKPWLRAKMLKPLLDAFAEADMVTGHNIRRFDLPVIQAEVSKGFKKGQDNLESLFGTQQQKLALNWQEWQDAYDEDGWKTIRDRAETDVVGHKQIRAELIELGYLKEPRIWSP